MSSAQTIQAPASTRWVLADILRVTASSVVLMTAAYYLVVAFDNITNPGSNWPFVQGVLSEDGVAAPSGFGWRDIDSHWFHVAAYIALIAFEAITALLLLTGGVTGLRASRHRQPWAAAQRWTFVGVLTGLLVFFFGFITVGGNWFVMYLNGKFNGLEPAFQNAVMTTLTALFVLGVLVADRLGVGASPDERADSAQ